MSETAAPIEKPWRIWTLQAIVAVQVLGRVSRLVRDLAGAASRLREPAVHGLALWLVGSLIWHRRIRAYLAVENASRSSRP